MVHHGNSLQEEGADLQGIRSFIQGDYQGFARDNREEQLFHFAEALTRSPHVVEEDDIEPLKEAGMSEDEISHAVQVISYFNYINRIAEGLGVQLEAEEFQAFDRQWLADFWPPARQRS